MKTLKPLANLHPPRTATIQETTSKALEIANDLILKIKRITPASPRTLENTLEPFNQMTATISEAQSWAHLMAAAHPDAAIRNAAEMAITKLSRFLPRIYSDPKIYDAITRVSEKNLDIEAKRFRAKELFDFKHMGIDKPPAIKKELKKLINAEVKFGQVFSRNIKDDVRYLKIPAKDLEGLPEDYCKAHAVDNKGKVLISTQYPDYYPFMQYATASDARRKLTTLYLNRAWPKNDAVLRKLLATRKRHAHLLGYRTWADFITADKMTGSASVAQDFLDRSIQITNKRAREDYQILIDRKKKDDPKAKKLEGWEISYYENIILRENIRLDTREVRHYFPFHGVRKGVLDTSARLFGLTFKKVTTPAWHQDVEIFDVYRKSKRIGRCYLDLHPREGKYGHAACFDIRQGIRDQQLPEAALLCNFSRDLMSHGEVTTFFHEFGHLMHVMLGGNQKWYRFSGTATEWDFIEAPSQMLEAWAFDYQTLKKFARHDKTNRPISRELVEKMNMADQFGKGIWIQRQLSLGSMSLHLHEHGNPLAIDLLAIMRKDQKKIASFPYVPGTHFYANFGHLNGYSAMYYTYMWSLAIAKDILEPFKKHGMQNRLVARDYRKKILMPGGSRDAKDLIHDFLGRNWNMNAFKKWID